MDELKELRRRLAQDRPVSWEALPDISLYMDQLIGYMPRQLIHAGGAEGLTSAMVNNYIKDGLLPRAEGKRYSREHLAYLTAICALKQVLPVKDAGFLVARHGGSPKEMYADFRALLDEALSAAAAEIDPAVPDEALAQLAMTLALESYADGLACRRIIELLREREPKPAAKGKKGRKGAADHGA